MAENPDFRLTRRSMVSVSLKAGLLFAWPAWSFGALGGGPGVEAQPYFASLRRALDAWGSFGESLPAPDAAQLAAYARTGDGPSVAAAEGLLRRHVVAQATVDPDGSAHLEVGAAPAEFVEQGWRAFLVRVANPGGRRDHLLLSAGWRTPGRMQPSSDGTAQRATLGDTLNQGPIIEKMGFLVQMHDTVPLVRFGRELAAAPLSGLPVEYQVVEVFARDHGDRRALLTLELFPRPGDGYGGSAKQEFPCRCLPSRVVTLRVRDGDGRGCVAALTIRDSTGHLYPPPPMRLAPDMSFQAQVYRGDGETMRLPDGIYTVTSARGPEYLRRVQAAAVDAAHAQLDVTLERWIDPSAWGWYSGDTHLHAGGCAHYQVPTEGVSPETMIRHVRGEGLSVGDVLTWGPSWYYQKQFFCGQAVSPAATLEHPELQAANNATLQPRPTAEDAESTLRYDVEVSGFPSSHAGHLVLLRLRNQDYPGTKLIEDWPSWNLPILRWARAQGSLAGYAHCGSGMVVDSTALPNYEIPPMDGIGTQEAIIDVTHGFVDFLSGCDTAPLAELNAWYHLLNCGYRLALIGETDFPCITGDRVGVGRSYVRLDRRPAGDAGYEDWIRGLATGRLYCGDGRSHFLEFTVDGHAGGAADLALDRPAEVAIAATVAARIEPVPTPETEAICLQARQPGSWGWHLERARLGGTRQVAVELVVNGEAVARATVTADGQPQKIRFTTRIAQSSWLALRIMPSGHTHPLFVAVGGKPVRASRRSARWCRSSVDKVWEVKSPFMRESERADAAAAFDHARRAYERIAAECAS